LSAADLRDPVLHRVCIVIGSNIDAEANTRHAVEALGVVGKIKAVSSTWETPSEGSPGPDFLDTAVLLETSYDLETLKWQHLRRIEADLGRIRTVNKNAPRTVDLDIIIYDDQLIASDLFDRVYLAMPVSELLPDLSQPLTGTLLSQIAPALIKRTPARKRSVLQTGS
jgi:2-amino-4-hydroxy-6-hydroxymethyldihydropteridine diphosphokinase